MTDGPDHGARFEISLETKTDTHATYAISVHEADAIHEAIVTIGVGIVDTKWTTEPPRWIADTTQGFMKMIEKNHAGDSSWPSRLVRWRAERE